MDEIVASYSLLLSAAVGTYALITKRKRKWWVRPKDPYVVPTTNTDHTTGTTEHGEQRRLIKELELHDHVYYLKYFQMLPCRFEDLVRRIGPHIEKQDSKLRRPISVGERLAVTLRYLRTGESQQAIAYSYRFGRSTVSCIILETCEALWTVLQPEYLQPPSTTQEWNVIAQRFMERWNFPHCIGALGGKHVLLQPVHTESVYLNSKGTFSLVLLAVCDADYCFTIVDIGAYGHQTDDGIFSSSSFGQQLSSNSLNIPNPHELPNYNQKLPYVIVTDEAFPLKENIMRPFPGQDLSVKYRVFNYRLLRSRHVIENTFGIVAAKWRILRRPINASFQTSTAIVKSIVCLHNYLKKGDAYVLSGSRYCPPTFSDYEDLDGNVHSGEWRSITTSDAGLVPVERTCGNTYTPNAARVREQIVEYFMSAEGAVPWQLQHISQ